MIEARQIPPHVRPARSGPLGGEELWSLGGMADAEDLKSFAPKAYGFESRRDHFLSNSIPTSKPSRLPCAPGCD